MHDLDGKEIDNTYEGGGGSVYGTYREVPHRQVRDKGSLYSDIVKRHVAIRHLKLCGCYLLREGGKHSIYVNPANKYPLFATSQTRRIPGGKICRDLAITEC